MKNYGNYSFVVFYASGIKRRYNNRTKALADKLKRDGDVKSFVCFSESTGKTMYEYFNICYAPDGFNQDGLSNE